MTKLKNKKIILLLIVLIIIMFFIQTRTSLSKYIYSAIHSYYLETKGFYFNSDKLSASHLELEVENGWSGAETYTITVNLNSKKNDLVFAKTDIDYEIEFTNSDNIECSVSKTSGTIKGSDSGGINEDYFILTINPKDGVSLNSSDLVWIELEVTSTAPYTQTISGKLSIGVGSDDISYEIIDVANRQYMEVNITNSLSEAKDVALAFDPEVILLDMTSEFSINATDFETQLISGNQYVNKVISQVRPLETMTVKFYKIDSSQDYTYNVGDTTTPVVTLSY